MGKRNNEGRYPSRWSARDVQVIVVGAVILVGLALLVLLFERAGPENGPEEWNQQDRPQVEQWPQKRQIDDQEMRLQKLERDLWDRENERRMETLKFFGDR